MTSNILTLALIMLGVACCCNGLLDSLLSAWGNAESAKAANKAGEKSLQLYTKETDIAKILAAYEALGSDAEGFLKGILPQDRYAELFGSPAQTITRTVNQPATGPGTGMSPEASRFSRYAGTGIPGGSQGPGTYTYQDPAKPGSLNVEALKSYYANKKGTLGSLEDVATQAREGNKRLLSDYDLDSRRLERRGRVAEDEVRKYGMGREAQIERDVGKAHKSADAMDMADMIASGLGSSTLTSSAKRANARTFGDLESDAKQDLADERLQKYLDVFGKSTEQMAGRSFGRASLADTVLTRDASLAAQPAMARQNLFGSKTFNPFLGQDTTAYFPGLSPWGVGMSSFGNSATAKFGAVMGAAGGAAGAMI